MWLLAHSRYDLYYSRDDRRSTGAGAWPVLRVEMVGEPIGRQPPIGRAGELRSNYPTSASVPTQVAEG